MEILGRQLQVAIVQNLGNGNTGNMLDVSDYLEDIGNVQFDLDKTLNKVAIGSISIRLFDDTIGTVWSFLENQISVSNGIYPPFLIILLGGEPKYYGVIDLKNIQKSVSGTEFNISISSQDWYSMASRLELDIDFWKRDNPVSDIPRPASAERQGSIPGVYAILGHLGVNVAVPYLSKVYFPAPNNWFQVNDRFTCSTVPGTFVCTSAKEVENPLPSLVGNYIETTLAGFKWANPGGDIWYWLRTNTILHANFTRISEETTEQAYFQLAENITPDEINPKYAIKLDTVSGIVPGDKLDLRSDASRKTGASFIIIDVDSEKSTIVTQDPIETTMITGDRLYYSAETLTQMVYGNIRDIISKANSIGPTDFSKFTPATLPTPALSWLPFRVLNGSGASGSILLSPCDIQPSLTGLEVKGQGSLGWSGTPEDGWSANPWSNKVVWTDQRLTAPSSLMPDESDTLAKYTPKRNRNHGLGNWKARNKDDRDSPPYDDRDNDISSACLVYDYSSMRRYLFTRASRGVAITGKYNVWNGSSWGSDNSLTWVGTTPQCMIPFSEVPSSLGSGYSLLSLDSLGVISIKYGTSSATLALDPALKNGVLKQTAYGSYLITQKGYGKISYNAGSLSLSYVALTDEKDINLIPSTFCALDENRIYCMASTIWTNPEDLKKTYEVYTLELNPSPDMANPKDAIRAFEKASDGNPRIAIAFKDPSENRIIGLLGCRLLQISSTMSEVIERYSAEGLTASSLIDNICMIHNCMAVPRPNGILEIISRGNVSLPINVNVDILEERKPRMSDYFISQANISGNNEEIFAYAISDSKGGITYEMQDHPFITTSSQAKAVALTYIDFFGRERKAIDQTWTWTGGGVAPWEYLTPNQIITVNGFIKQWYLIKLNASLKDYEAQVTLLEV